MLNWYEIIISSFNDISEEISFFFSRYGIDEMIIEDPNELNLVKESDSYWDYIDEESVSYGHDDIIYKVYAELSEYSCKKIKEELNEFLSKLRKKASLVSINVIDPNVGLDEWKKYFKPFEICEGVVICPSWEEYEKKEEQIVIKMDPSGAFGTGTHETTYMCAKLIQKVLEKSENKIKKMLDIGTGSGILSIIALKLGVEISVGTEIDENALKIASENAINNSVFDKFYVQGADKEYGEDNDLIVANLIAPVIVELYPRIKKAIKKGGYVILSGIIDSSKEEVKNIFKNDDFELHNELSENDWNALMYRRKL